MTTRVVVVAALAACSNRSSSSPPAAAPSRAEARAGFQSKRTELAAGTFAITNTCSVTQLADAS